jgi:hypothetical protein
MATSSFFKVNDFVEQLCKGAHDFTTTTGDVFKIGLTNVDPTSAATDFNLLTEITAQFGYTAGGETVPGLTLVEAAGTATVDASPTVFTAAGGSFGPFQYAVLYNSTPSAGALTQPIVGYYDYGAPVTLNDTETFTVNITTNIFTIA